MLSLFSFYRTQVTKGGDNMVNILIHISFLIIFWILGYAFCCVFRKPKNVGTILIVEQENEEPTLLLEINQGMRDSIVPGNVIELNVDKYVK